MEAPGAGGELSGPCLYMLHMPLHFLGSPSKTSGFFSLAVESILSVLFLFRTLSSRVPGSFEAGLEFCAKLDDFICFHLKVSSVLLHQSIT